MTSFGVYKDCAVSHNLAQYGASHPPSLASYPPFVRPVRLLFIGVNPPPDGGLWVNDADPLLEKLLWVFQKLGWTACSSPRDFREDLRSHFYFIHAVKCFNETKFPSGRPARNLIKGCVETHLSSELDEIQPERICVLGEVALRALIHGVKHGGGQVLSAIPADAAALGEEIHVRIRDLDRALPVLVTYFPRDKFLGRALLLSHLRRWTEIAEIHRLLGASQ